MPSLNHFSGESDPLSGLFLPTTSDGPSMIPGAIVPGSILNAGIA
jgi:hypothetical protein